jgi:glutaredoxin
MPESNFDLYLKPGCPWCTKAVRWLDERGFDYQAHDVIADPEKFDEMATLTGQTLAPCLRVRVAEGDDLILPDFGPEELEAFVAAHALAP